MFGNRFAVRRAETSTAITRVHEVGLDAFAARDHNGEMLHCDPALSQRAKHSGRISPPGWNADLGRSLRRQRHSPPSNTHQAAAAEAVHAGKNVVIVTPTASGKTLCYNLPVLNEVLENSDTRALYLFPTKALAQRPAR